MCAPRIIITTVSQSSAAAGPLPASSRSRSEREAQNLPHSNENEKQNSVRHRSLLQGGSIQVAECVCELREEEEEELRSHTLWSVKSERDPPSRRGIDFGKKRRKNEVKKFEPEANRRAGSERVAKCASSNPLCRRGGESSRNLVAVVLFSTSVCCCVNLSFDSLRASRRRLFVV